MKNLLKIALIFFPLMIWANEAPHYDVYPPTPAIEYKEEILDFYSRSKPYGEFSNFALFPVWVDEKWWPTTEHYFQAMKYLDPKLISWVQDAPTPEEAAKRGRDESFPKRPDWTKIRDNVMEKALWDKFYRYPSLRALLLSTNKARLFEHTTNDCYWGDCGDRCGKNKLGLMLEKIRHQIHQEENQ